MRGPFWTAAEDSVLRAGYRRSGDAAKVAQLLGRTVTSVYVRARRLGLATHARWTAADDQKLRMLWGEFSLGVIARKLGRTKHGVFNHAYDLGLPLGVPDGCEYLTDAAKRCGVWVETLRRILGWADVPIRRTISRPTKKYVRRPRHFVDVFEVNEAVAAWTKTEAVSPAARERRVDPRQLAKRLAVIDGVPRKPEGRRHWRVSSEVIDRAIGRAA